MAKQLHVLQRSELVPQEIELRTHPHSGPDCLHASSGSQSLTIDNCITTSRWQYACQHVDCRRLSCASSEMRVSSLMITVGFPVQAVKCQFTDASVESPRESLLLIIPKHSYRYHTHHIVFEMLKLYSLRAGRS